MIKLLKKLLQLAPKENLDAPPKMRVRPFTKTSDPYYLPEYFYKGKWVPFTNNWMHFDNLRLWENRRKNIFADFEEAVSFCKQWKTLREILENRAALDKEFEESKQNFLKIINNKQKTWESN